MDTKGIGTSRTCPACGARNSELSLFCAECGSGLNGESWHDQDQTQAFQPAAASKIPHWSPPANDIHEPEISLVDTTSQVGSVPSSSEYQAIPEARTGSMVSTWSSMTPTNDRGARGFFLGLIAWFLILTVFGVYLWSSVLDSGLRDDIRDLIPGLAAILFRT